MLIAVSIVYMALENIVGRGFGHAALAPDTRQLTAHQQPTTNNQQPTTNNQQPTTNNQQPTTLCTLPAPLVSARRLYLYPGSIFLNRHGLLPNRELPNPVSTLHTVSLRANFHF